mmetsp:Transcript_50941/g.103567  ORF Transcript_50941/g.103567 Transcript_50941/m.103567 type:complete len:132 (+) Transcript_50941:222-617(+)
MTAIQIIKKKTKKFIRHHSDRYKRLKKNWRKPKGIDSCVRRKFKGKTLMPNIGFGSNKKTRNLTPHGLYKIKIQNCEELQMVLMANKKFEVEIDKRVGYLKKKAILKKALSLDLKISNPPKKQKKAIDKTV